MPRIVGKAFAYITRGERLLLFTHPLSPEAGIQVPAGTIKPGESPEEAVLREAWEETGLEVLTVVNFLGENDVPRPGGYVDRRYFFHLRCEREAPETWRHFEEDASDGSTPIPFDFFWAPLDELPELIAGHGRFAELRESLAAEAP